MKYLHEESGVVYSSLGEFRRASGIAFPADPDDEMLGMLGLKRIEPEPGEALEEARRRPWRNSTACFWISGRIGRR